MFHNHPFLRCHQAVLMALTFCLVKCYVGNTYNLESITEVVAFEREREREFYLGTLPVSKTVYPL
jgi:hypothetical protein